MRPGSAPASSATAVTALANGGGVFYIYCLMRSWPITVALVLTVLASAGCSKRQLGPTLLAGGGAGLLVSGVAYRASFHDEEDAGLLGRTAEQRAVTATLAFSGLALILAGVIWSATTPVCESNGDCWVGDVCERSTSTCVPAPANDPDAATLSVETPPWFAATGPASPRLMLTAPPPFAPVSRWQLAVP